MPKSPHGCLPLHSPPIGRMDPEYCNRVNFSIPTSHEHVVPKFHYAPVVWELIGLYWHPSSQHDYQCCSEPVLPRLNVYGIGTEGLNARHERCVCVAISLVGHPKSNLTIHRNTSTKHHGSATVSGGPSSKSYAYYAIRCSRNFDF